MAKRLGVVPFPYAAPLFRGLRRNPGREFELTEDVPVRLAVKLRERSLDAAFLSPIDYGRDYAMYSVLPDLCTASGADSSLSLIVFREGINAVKTLAAQPISTSEIVLASIIFTEQFGITPSIVPFAGSPRDGLAKADAVLCVGNEAGDLLRTQSTLNLAEEWYELTGLPFVHGVWVTRPDALTEEEVRRIHESAEGAEADPAFEESGVRFAFGEGEREGVRELFRMAYYHGILPDIPDLNLYRKDDERLKGNDQ